MDGDYKILAAKCHNDFLRIRWNTPKNRLASDRAI